MALFSFLNCNNTHVRLCFRDTYNYLLLKLPTCISNRNYAEFRSELKSVLKSDVWVMEWSKIWKKWMHLLKHCEIGSVVIQFKITHKSIFFVKSQIAFLVMNNKGKKETDRSICLHRIRLVLKATDRL